jgi:hypothetical protein
VLDGMRVFGLNEEIREQIRVRRRKRGYSESKKVEALVLPMAAGGESVDDIQILKADAGLSLCAARIPAFNCILQRRPQKGR